MSGEWSREDDEHEASESAPEVPVDDAPREVDDGLEPHASAERAGNEEVGEDPTQQLADDGLDHAVNLGDAPLEPTDDVADLAVDDGLDAPVDDRTEAAAETPSTSDADPDEEPDDGLDALARSEPPVAEVPEVEDVPDVKVEDVPDVEPEDVPDVEVEDVPDVEPDTDDTRPETIDDEPETETAPPTETEQPGDVSTEPGERPASSEHDEPSEHDDPTEGDETSEHDDPPERGEPSELDQPVEQKEASDDDDHPRFDQQALDGAKAAVEKAKAIGLGDLVKAGSGAKDVVAGSAKLGGVAALGALGATQDHAARALEFAGHHPELAAALFAGGATWQAGHGLWKMHRGGNDFADRRGQSESDRIAARRRNAKRKP